MALLLRGRHLLLLLLLLRIVLSLRWREVLVSGRAANREVTAGGVAK